MGIKSDLVAKRNELAAVNETVKKAREESAVSGGDFDLMKSTVLKGANVQDRVNEMRTLKNKQDALGKEVDELVEAMKSFDSPEELEQKGGMIHGAPGQSGRKSIGERFTESAEFKAMAAGGKEARLDLKDVGLKTLMQTSAGFAPQSIRESEVERYPSEPVTLFSFVPKGQTGQAAIVYMEETTRTLSAAEKTEANAYAESALEYTERSETVRDVGHFIPVTRAQLDDVPMIRSMIDEEMRAGLLERLDTQLISGDASAPNLRGAFQASGLQTLAAAGKPMMDVILMAIGKIGETAFANPNLVVLNGADWQTVQLMKTDDGQYIWGHPSEVGPQRVWGRQIVPTYRIAKGTGLVGDFNKMKYYERTGVTVEISDSHDTYFIYNKLAIRCWTRGAFVWRRGSAFCKLTGLA